VVVDTSALIAIIEDEPDAERLEVVLSQNAGNLFIGAPTLVEAAIVVLRRHSITGAEKLFELVRDAGIEVVPFTGDHIKTAACAYFQYGKGRHEAQLNFGDCFSYAIAIDRNDTLLFKGDDFGKTNIRRAIPP